MTISTPRQASSPARPRLGAFYAASFLVVGIQLPFWPVWLAGRGLDAHGDRAAVRRRDLGQGRRDPADWRPRRPARAGDAASWSRSPPPPASPMPALWPVAGFWPLLCAQPRGRRGAIGADAARRQHHPRGGAQRRARLRPHPGLGFGQLHRRRDRQRRLAGAAAAAPVGHPTIGAAAGARRLGRAAGRVLCITTSARAHALATRRAGRRSAGLPPTAGSGCSSSAPRRCSRAISSITVSARSIGANSASPTRSSACCGPKASSPRSCCSGTARRWSRASGRSG